MFKFKRYEDAKEARIFVETDNGDLVSVKFLSQGVEVRPLEVEFQGHGMAKADRAEQIAHAILQAIAQARVEVWMIKGVGRPDEYGSSEMTV